MRKILASVAVLLVVIAGVLSWRSADGPPSAASVASATSAPAPSTSSTPSPETSSGPTSPETSSPTTSPVVRLHRGTSPSRAASRQRDAGGHEARAAADDAPSTGQPRQVTLDDLDPDVRDRLGHAAMGHLHDLADACEGTLSGTEDLGAFVTLDRDGVVELELRPIGDAPGDIQVEARDLPQALVDCLDERLWSQDWSDVGPSVPDGAELPVALTMRLSP